MNHYKPSIPRVALGIAAVAMTAITIAVSTILPAQVELGSREPRMLAASKATAPQSMGLAAVTSIGVVYAGEPRSSAVPVRMGEAESQPGRRGKTASPEVVRVSSE